MAKKKSKKKELKKLDIIKKKLKKKSSKKKDSKKKESKKKDSKKKDSKKKDSKKKGAKKKSSEIQNERNPLIAGTSQLKTQKSEPADHSSNYNVSDAVKKLSSMKSLDELIAFTKGEKRLTITKVIPGAKNRLKKV